MRQWGRQLGGGKRVKEARSGVPGVNGEKGGGEESGVS